MTIKLFEELRGWQVARGLTKQLYSICKTSPGFRCDRQLRDQLQAVSISLMSNIAEGFSRRSAKEFTPFLIIAKRSAAEVQSPLYVAIDQDYMSSENFAQL